MDEIQEVILQITFKKRISESKSSEFRIFDQFKNFDFHLSPVLFGFCLSMPMPEVGPCEGSSQLECFQNFFAQGNLKEKK